jgi:hypothetical protein
MKSETSDFWVEVENHFDAEYSLAADLKSVLFSLGSRRLVNQTETKTITSIIINFKY